MKKILCLILSVACVAVLSGCASSKATESPSAGTDKDNMTWAIELRAAELSDGLHTDEGVQQYDGSVLNVAYDDVPSDGTSFLILTLTITKNQVGRGAFQWNKLFVLDEAGNAYPRMDNDVFLSHHRYNRLPATPLQIGENRGSICFELPKAAINGSLTLCYDAGEDGLRSMQIQEKP